VVRYESFNCTLDLAPGLAFGVKPDTLQLNPSIFLPFSNLIVSQAITSVLAISSANSARVLVSGRLMAVAI